MGKKAELKIRQFLPFFVLPIARTLCNDNKDAFVLAHESVLGEQAIFSGPESLSRCSFAIIHQFYILRTVILLLTGKFESAVYEAKARRDSGPSAGFLFYSIAPSKGRRHRAWWRSRVG